MECLRTLGYYAIITPECLRGRNGLTMSGADVLSRTRWFETLFDVLTSPVRAESATLGRSGPTPSVGLLLPVSFGVNYTSSVPEAAGFGLPGESLGRTPVPSRFRQADGGEAVPPSLVDCTRGGTGCPPNRKPG